jgi:hypothetical protein
VLRNAQNSAKNAQWFDIAHHPEQSRRTRPGMIISGNGLKQCIFALYAPPNFMLSFEVASPQSIFSFKKPPTKSMVIH